MQKNIGGNWYNKKLWSRDAKRAQFKASSCCDFSLQSEVTAAAIDFVVSNLYLLTLPIETRNNLCGMESIRREAQALLAEYGELNVLHCDSLPKNLKTEAISLGNGFYLTKERVSMPLQEFLFYVRTLDCNQRVIEEWAGISNDKISDFIDALIGFLHGVIRQKHREEMLYARTPVVAISAAQKAQFDIHGCMVGIFH